MAVISRDVSSKFVTGQGTVGTSATVLTSTEFAVTREVKLLPNLSNTGEIYLGNTSSITTSSGQRIPATGIKIPIDSPTKIYLIASAASQGYSWSAF